jgi:ATP-binding cassette subfamily B protein/subfamily B ATP-binding cassette protein MsbA
MREFWHVIKRYVAPYKKYLWGSVGLNILSAIFNIFSFSVIIPMLRILFKMNDKVYERISLSLSTMNIKELGNGIVNNAYWYIQTLMETRGGTFTLMVLCLFLIVMTLLKTTCYFGSSAVMIPIRTGVMRDLRMQIYDKILKLPIGFFSEERKGDIIARMSGDVQEIDNSIMSSLDMLIKNPILIIFYVGTLFFVSWKMTLFTIVVVPFLGWIMGVIGRQLKKKSLQAQELWSDTMSQVEETLGGLRVIKAFIAESTMGARFYKITDAYRRKTGRVSTRQALAHPVSEFLGTVLIVIVLLFGGILILSDHSPIDAPTFMYYMVILYSVINPLKEFSKASYNIPKGLASMERVDKILQAENTIKESPKPLPLTSFDDKIEINHVNFSYEEGREVLHDICLTIPKGKTIAIVGESGAGKSTMADLIPRFYDVSSGAILIDGKDIRDVKLHDLRSLIGYVNQEPILFNDTIFNNIAFGVKDATQEQVEEAAKIANAHEFIMEKEDGYQTIVGDRGSKLSGGQRQRISIARAILKNPPILILDEATASLDTESERLVQEAIGRLMSNRTTIAIAHRLSTIKNSDEIIVLHEGSIVERGRHEELIAKGGFYKHLNDMQSL